MSPFLCRQFPGPSCICNVGIFDRIQGRKSAVMEPRDGALFPAAAEAFRLALKDPTGRGAVFFAVCRRAPSGSLVRLEPGYASC